MGQSLLGEEVEGQRDASRQADALRALPKMADMQIGVRIRLGRQQLARKPEHALGLVLLHELVNDGLEVREDFDLGEGVGFLNGHPEIWQKSRLWSSIPGCPNRGHRLRRRRPPRAAYTTPRSPTQPALLH